ncbi:MAG: hypothetical protein U0Z44_13175 [Kouleothrix sp.]
MVYLAKLIEISAKFHPGRLGELLDQRIFSHANVPYRIKDYAALLDDWYATIEFDWTLEQRIAERVARRGADGKLLLDAEGRVVHATLAEKLLILLLAKLVNLVPEGGIWMNTQRPEWNDANNALVGKGLSVVTVAYLRRYIVLCRHLFAASAAPGLVVSAELGELFHAVGAGLAEHQPALEATFSDARRRAAMDALGRAGSAYRTHYYQHGRSGAETRLSLPVLALLDMAQHYASTRCTPIGATTASTTPTMCCGLARAAPRSTGSISSPEGQVAILGRPAHQRAGAGAVAQPAAEPAVSRRSAELPALPRPRSTGLSPQELPHPRPGAWLGAGGRAG